MAVVRVDDILSNLPLGFASLIVRPVPTVSAIERFLIVDADDDAPVGTDAFVLLIGVRGRSALPALRRLLKNTPPPVVAPCKRFSTALKGIPSNPRKLLNNPWLSCILV
ncbi:hypothetical protein ACLH0K_03725 [Arthrobacter sp. MPF02]|uniref:hypothetical protein n=1 Tax=Arthrobacter sp. MPF02 TaxID=3388492 RepID=UPI0039852E14